MFNFIVIDHRKPVISPNTLGIEVTIPEIAARCDLGNIDPQHIGSTTRVRIHDPATGEDKGYRLDPVVWAGHGAIDCGGGPRNCLPIAAIDAVVAWPPPPDGATLATIRPDLDAFGAMAVLALRAVGSELTAESLARIAVVAAADGNARTTWEPRPLPTAADPWPAGAGSLDNVRPLAAIASVCSLHNTSVAYRVAVVAAWLLGGDTPTPEQVHTAAMACIPSLSAAPFDVIDTLAECRARVEAERADMIAALGDGRIKIDVRLKEGGWGATTNGTYSAIHTDDTAEREFAIVRSAHRAATSLGQSVAPLAICFHPAFPWPSGEKTPKTTIAWAVPPGVETVTRVRDALNAAEREKIATQIDSIDLGVTYEGDFPGVFFDARPGRPAVGAATLLRGGHVAEALEVIASMRSADAERFAKDIAIIAAAIRGEWGGNLASGILGSPQGRASLLSEDEIASLVRGAL